MESAKSPPGSVRRAGRNISHPTLQRRSTKGPLDSADDPLAATSVKDVESTNETPSSNTRPVSAVVQSVPSTTKVLPLQLRFLQDPRLYHQVPKDGIPQVFLNSPQQPPVGTTITDLLKGGHFRRAAEVAVQDLLQASTDDASQILQLFYCRLACLTLIARPDLAADEALPLLDFLSSNAPGVAEVAPLIPWQLRILVVRLQSVAAQDGGRRAIMTLYALASEARAYLRDARSLNDDTEAEIWSARLADVGLRVSDTLVEIGELETANRHLDSLKDIDQDELLSRKILLRLRTGDLEAAQRYVEEVTDTHKRAIFEALLTVANADTNQALSSWHSLAQQWDNNELAAQNEAVYLLYTGRIEAALHILQTLAEKGQIFHTLLFNLNTIHELCSDKAPSKKLELAGKLASRSTDSGIVWERSTIELKL